MATTYKYLGLTFSICGSFTTAKQELKRLQKGLFQNKEGMGVNFKSNAQISLKLFEILIKPILLYGSEIWGVDKYLPETQNPIEQIFKNTFYKQVLGVNCKTSTLACRIELSQFCLQTVSQTNRISFWTRIITLKDNSLRVKSYKEMSVPLIQKIAARKNT